MTKRISRPPKKPGPKPGTTPKNDKWVETEAERLNDAFVVENKDSLIMTVEDYGPCVKVTISEPGKYGDAVAVFVEETKIGELAKWFKTVAKRLKTRTRLGHRYTMPADRDLNKEDDDDPGTEN